MPNTSTSTDADKSRTAKSLDKLIIASNDAQSIANEEVTYAKAIFVAIAALASQPSQQKTVLDLARLGQWVTENTIGNLDYFSDRLTSVSSEVH